MTLRDLCSGWQQGCPSQMGTAEDLGDQATSLQFWHLVVGGRFLPFTLRNVENHSSSVWRGIRGWLTWSSYVQMLRNNFPPTLARTSLRTISQNTIRHPEPKTLHMLRRPLMGFWCHSVRGNQGKIKFTLSYAALQLLWKAALNIPEFLASLQNVFLMGQKKKKKKSVSSAMPCSPPGTMLNQQDLSHYRWQEWGQGSPFFFFEIGRILFMCFY